MKAWQKIVIAISLLGMAASCRNDPAPENPKIEKIIFEERSKDIYIGDTVKVNITATPKEAKAYNKIAYRTSESGIIAIKANSGNDGVVFEGVKRGTTVITAAVNGAVDYCSVNVLGGDAGVIPHIIVPYYVMECRENERRSIVASLAGGTPIDDNGFIWSYSDQKVISLESSGNIGVFDTLNIGASVVTISHPKAQFSVNVLVYVIGNDEMPVFITTDNNVVNLKTTDSNYQYAVELRGGDSGDYHNFRHELLDGGEIVELRTNNNIGAINPKAKGVARIGISHPKAAYRLEIVVIVNEEIEYRYIDVDKTLIIMEEGHSEILKAELIGDVPQDHIDKYIIDNEDDNVIEAQQSHNQFRITALQRGRSVLKIKNEYADFDREVLVIVNGTGSVYDHETYITTNQNVITTEAGGDDVVLTMTLVGGNEADRNNFVWTVDDGSIISVESAHGRVEYINRSAAGNVGEKFEAQAVIKAKKAGTAKITLENPKAKNNFSVMVKVYKKGVFGVVPVVIDGPGIYKVAIGEKLPAYLQVVTGNARNLANVTWESENSSIVSVSGAGLTGMLEGKSAGITAIRVSGDNVKHDYTATVIVGSEEYLKTMPFIYVVNPFISVIKGESVSLGIMCENMSGAEIAAINVVNNSGDIMEVFAYKNNVTITGIALGEGEIIIGGGALNTLRVAVMVEDYNLTPDTPYYLRSDKFIYGLVKGRNLEIGVDLVGGSAANERNIIWEIEDSHVAVISGNGKRCVITGRNAGQTVIRVKHPKSHNDLEMVIYTAENETELNGKIVMYAKERNMLLGLGETRYVSIITNASDAQKSGFQWSISNAGVIDVGISGDRLKAYVTAKSAGNATITVRSGAQAPVVIYVSVLNKANGGAYVNVPSIVEMAAGQTMSINAVINNIYDKINITWKSQDETVVAAYGNGDACLVTALKGGDTIIRVEYEPAGFVKDIVVYVYNSIDDMASKYIIAGEQSRYVINKGDIVNINAVFGMKGYPEYEIPNIWWRTNDNTIIEVTGNGKTANIRGLNAGIGIITVSSRNDISNTVDIEVEVRDSGKAGQYWLSVNERDRIRGILAGSFADIEIKVFNGNNEIFNISGMEYIVEHDDIISVTANGNSIRVHAAAGKEGQSYITIKHDLVEDARLLIFTALSEYGLENAYPVLVTKTNYLIKKGDNVTVTVQTKDNDNAKLRNISYGLERNNGAISVSERSKREIAVNANNVGSDVILVRYNAAVVQRIYVSVTEAHYGPNAGYLITENIIGLLWDTEYETRIETNIDSGIMWRKQNDYVIDIVSSSGKSAVIKGALLGKTILTVSAGGIERNIAVFVCKTEDELRQYQAINIEQRQYRIRKNESITVNIHSYQGKVAGETRYGDYYQYDSPYGNVITVNAVENNKFSVKGINEGTAAIRVTNEYYRTEIVVYIEVAPAGEGGAGIVDRQHYITAAKTLYVIDKDDRNVFIPVNVIGDDFYGDAYWIWSDYDRNIISVNAMGREALVNPVKEGRTTIKVSNKDCANSPLEITVIVGDRFVIDDNLLPYIYVEKNLYEVTKDDGAIPIPYSIVNVHNVNTANIWAMTYGNTISVKHDAINSTFNVTVHETGIARFEIMYENLRREVYVLVKENMNHGNIYLTTSENYVVASVGEMRLVNIQLAGYDEKNSNNFEWKVNTNGIIQLAGNGTVGQIYAVGAGKAVIEVKHHKAEPYSLKINVEVVRDKTKESVVYLTTQRNVIETVAGTVSETIYVQKVGGNMAKDNLIWESSDPSIVEITNPYRGYSAQFNAKKEGVARIKVTNPEETAYALEIVVIVRPSFNNNIYIDTSDTLLMLSPGESQRRISATLVNGNVKDNHKFVWTIDNYFPSDVNVAAAGGRVINIVPSNEECFINAINEGTALLRVSNTKGGAESDLIITVYVSHYHEIGFSVSKKELVVGENEFVGINVPRYESLNEKVRVWVENLNGGSGGEICEVFYAGELLLLSGKKTGVVVVKASVDGKEGVAQLYVNVVEKADPNVNRIVAGKTLHILNLKSAPLTLNALISGPFISEVDNDGILWKTRLGDHNIIDIKPSNALPPYSAKGRQIEITPKKLGTAVITVSSSYVDEAYHKEISIIVADLGNVFSISRTDVTVNSLRPETITAEIAGGTTRDYAEIKWIARMQQKWDGTMLEVVRIMGSGREVTLYPMNDGETEVLAVYGKYTVSIKVKVVSDYYFSFRNGNEYMWPGERRDLPFDVRPAGSNINWINVNPAPNEEPVVTYGEVTGSSPGGAGNAGSVNRYLQVEARREGTTAITGMANGKIASVNIIVQYDYSFIMPKAAPNDVSPKHMNKDASGRVTSSSDGIMTVSYTVHPANTYIRPESANIPGLTIEVMEPEERTDSKGRTVGVGTIQFTGTREMVQTVSFQQYKARSPGSDRDVAVDNNPPKQPSRQDIKIVYAFSDVSPIPYFIRGEGKYSNITNAASTVGDNSVPVPRRQYSLQKNGSPVTDGEYLANSAYTPSQLPSSYSVNLGDGEVHYILLDKKYEEAIMNITQIATEGGASSTTAPIGLASYTVDPKTGSVTNFNAGDNTAGGASFTASIVDITVDNIKHKAVRLSGGDDFIQYNRVAFNKELFLYVSSKYVSNAAKNDVMQTVDLFNNYYLVKYDTTVQKYTGPWTHVLKTNNTKSFYLLRNDDLMYIDNGMFSRIMGIYKAEYISAQQWLYDYHNDGKYTYCFDGNPGLPSENRSEYYQILGRYCDTVLGYEPVYRYSYTYYNANKNKFDRNKVYADYLEYNAGSPNPVGGYIVSYQMLDAELVTGRTVGNKIIYEYIPDVLWSMVNRESEGGYTDWSKYDFDLTLNSNGVYVNWDKGSYTDSMASSIPHYNPAYLYSSIPYTMEVSNVMVNGDEKVSVFNVTRNMYVNPATNTQIPASEVRIPNAPISRDYNNTSPYINNGTLRITSDGYIWRVYNYYANRTTLTNHEAFFYEGIMILPTYKSGSVNAIANCVPLYGGFASDSYSKIFVETITKSDEYGMTYNENVYRTERHGPNREGRIIFKMKNDGSLDYGDYGPYYYTGALCHWNNEQMIPDKNWEWGLWGYNEYFFSPARARQKLQWEDRATTVTVPYYIFNRFPYRYEGIMGNRNIVKLNDESSSRPMPSISRDTKSVNNIPLVIRYEKFDVGKSGNRAEAEVKLYINCQIRPSHSQYTGKYTDDTSLIDYKRDDVNSAAELEGPIKNFNSPAGDYNNPNLLKFAQ